MTTQFRQTHGANYSLYNGDSCQVLATLPDDSIDLTVSSLPFLATYIYSDSVADMGNCSSDEEFFTHFGYLIAQLHRITVPGRLCAIHCKDLPLYAGRDGAAGLKDFPGMIIRAFEQGGWVFHSRVTIWKDPVVERARTNNHGLLHKSFVARAEVCRQGMADYMLMFRKWDGVEGTESVKPVSHNLTPETHQFIGTNTPRQYKDDRDYSIQVWQRYASPVWFDVDQMDTLNYQAAKEIDTEKHICPLQLGVIRRCIDLWTNPGDVVLDPFGGIGSTGVCALEMGRKAICSELKPSYYDVAARYLDDAEFTASQPTMLELFDMVTA